MVTNGDMGLLTTSVITASSFVGSFLPDIDEPTSFIGRRIKPISSSLKHMLGHRGFIHTPLFGAIISYLLYISLKSFLGVDIAGLALTGFFIGFISHLVLDTITPKGIMWFFPIVSTYFSTQSQWLVKLILVTVTAVIISNYVDFGAILNIT